MRKKIVVLISGSGTNLQAIIDEVKTGSLQELAEISLVISNRKNAYGITRAHDNGIPCLYLPFLRKKMSRDEYEENLATAIISQGHPDLIVCAGWMHILGEAILDVLNELRVPIINLHPALPGMFPGADAIGDAWKAYQKGDIDRSGCMIHHVIPEIDAGAVIETCEVMIDDKDTEESFRENIRSVEKPTLIKAIKRLIEKKNFDSESHSKEVRTIQMSALEAEPEKYDIRSNYEIYIGKVRDVWNFNFNKLAIVHTNRFSSFDRHITNVRNKGQVLNLLSRWWFKQTEHIIRNHMLYATNNLMLVERCEMIPIEVVIRAYITGSTSTSLWTHYNNGERIYCGIKFPDGLVKNQKLEEPVITPTTKGEVDEPISKEEIISREIVTEKEWDYICYKALELFSFASNVALQAGYILVDTKLEFGRAKDGEIIVCDEMFTCDSSRYWVHATYHDRFTAGEPPDSFDKDIIREYIRARCDPYKDPLPEIPQELIQRVEQTYVSFYNNLTNSRLKTTMENPNVKDLLTDDEVVGYVYHHLNEFHSPVVLILSETKEDENLVAALQDALKEKNVFSLWQVCQAYQDTPRLLLLLEEHMDDVFHGKRKMVIVCLSKELAGLTAYNSEVPVIYYSNDDHIPNNLPVFTINDAEHCALHIARWFRLSGWLN